MSDLPVIEWTVDDVKLWLQNEGFQERGLIDKFSCSTAYYCIYYISDYHYIDGKTLLAINDYDFKCDPLNKLLLCDRKKLQISIKCLQRENHSSLIALGIVEPGCLSNCIGLGLGYTSQRLSNEGSESFGDSDRVSPPVSVDERSTELKPEIWKAGLSIAYAFLVMWITSLVMVLVHDRVPDMKIYPPLPDIVLDNVPHIPLAFTLCEVLGTVLALIWFCCLVVHKHRMILIRRFFALAGTVFLLRCITMLITSLSVPGTHLKCEPRDTPAELVNSSFYDELQDKISRAFIIWRGGGLSIRGVRTCGDYMFSGHTVALTLLNFFITEYTDSNYLHIVTWILNLFGVFFILAAHEHYSIDVFIAFYITSRLFLYYHTLANNQALMQRDSTRTRIWFPMFSYFESSVDGIVPNEYHTFYDIFTYFFKIFIHLKKICVKYLKILIHKLITFSNIFLQQTTYPRNRRIDVGTDNISNDNVNKKCQ